MFIQGSAMRLFRPFVSLLLTFSIVTGSLSQSFAQTAVSREVDCNVSSEQEFKSRLEKIIDTVMFKALEGVDYTKTIDKSWKDHKVNRLIDKIVKRESDRIKDEKSTIELVSTIGSSEAREELAIELAESVYGSEDFKRVIGYIAEDVGKTVSSRLDSISSDAGANIAKCVRKYVGPRYGETMAVFVSHQTRKEMSIDPENSAPQTGVGDIISASAGGLTGGLLIILRRALVQRLTKWIGKRLIGTVIARIVGAFTGIIGWILVVKEVWDFRHGVLPMITTEMKSKKTKEQVKLELTKGLDSELKKALKSVPGDVANSIYDIWVRFKDKNKKVLALLEKHPEFRVELSSVRTDNERLGLSRMRKTNDLVTLLLEVGGENAFLASLKSGQLKKGILELSESGVQVAVDTKSIDTAFQWHAIAGKDMKQILANDLHRTAKPEEYDNRKLTRLFELKQPHLIKKVTSLNSQEREVIFSLPQDQFNKFIRAHSSTQLAAISNYIKALPPHLSKRFVRDVKSDPGKMALLARSDVQYGVLNSSNQDAALAMMLREKSPVEIAYFPADMRLILNGEISPVLLWHKQPLSVMIAGILSLLVLLFFYRLLFRRRKKA